MASSGGDVVERVRAAVNDSLCRARLIGSRRTLIVAVSGGADSLCLLDALATVVRTRRLRLRVAHVDHQIRSSSANDAAHVGTAALVLGLPFEMVAVDVPVLASRERRGVEDAARVGRYRALRQLAHDAGSGIVATGHTANDAVETVLLHLLRGSGLDGLGGMHERETLLPRALGLGEDVSRPLTIVRPLLAVTRADTVAYCEARSLAYLTDETNADSRLLRNRIRAHLLPILRTYNPSVDAALARMAAAVQDDEAWMSRKVETIWRRLTTLEEGAVRLRLPSWRRQPVAVQRRLVRRAAEALGHAELGFAAVERALAAGIDGGPSAAELGGGVRVTRAGDSLRFWRQHPTSAATGRGDDDGE